MADLSDKDLLDAIRKGQRLTTMTLGPTASPWHRPKYKFQQYGKSCACVQRC